MLNLGLEGGDSGLLVSGGLQEGFDFSRIMLAVSIKGCYMKE